MTVSCVLSDSYIEVEIKMALAYPFHLRYCLTFLIFFISGERPNDTISYPLTT